MFHIALQITLPCGWSQDECLDHISPQKVYFKPLSWQLLIFFFWFCGEMSHFLRYTELKHLQHNILSCLGLRTAFYVNYTKKQQRSICKPLSWQFLSFFILGRNIPFLMRYTRAEPIVVQNQIEACKLDIFTNYCGATQKHIFKSSWLFFFLLLILGRNMQFLRCTRIIV